MELDPSFGWLEPSTRSTKSFRATRAPCFAAAVLQGEGWVSVGTLGQQPADPPRFRPSCIRPRCSIGGNPRLDLGSAPECLGARSARATKLCATREERESPGDVQDSLRL